MKILLTAISCSLSLLAGIATAEAATVTLYNGALGTAPSSQGWISQTTGATQTVGGGATTLNTTANDGVQAGYSRFTPLNRTTGYTLSFRVQLLAEDHSNPAAQNNTAVDNIADRAGFSIIVLSSDLQGIELGFWTNDLTTTNRIWAQNDGPVKADPVSAPSGTRFTHAEGTSFNPSSGLINYDLSVLNNSYTLYANSSPILSGALRNYSNEGSVYGLSNFLFFGDNTTSARGSFSLASVAATDAPITSAAAVPYEFSPTIGLLTLGAFATISYLKKRQP